MSLRHILAQVQSNPKVMDLLGGAQEDLTSGSVESLEVKVDVQHDDDGRTVGVTASMTCRVRPPSQESVRKRDTERAKFVADMDAQHAQQHEHQMREHEMRKEVLAVARGDVKDAIRLAVALGLAPFYQDPFAPRQGPGPVPDLSGIEEMAGGLGDPMKGTSFGT